MKKILLSIWLLLVSLNFGFALDLQVDILNKYHNPVPVLVSEFYIAGDDSSDIYQNFKAKLLDNLEQSGTVVPRVTNENLISDYIINSDIDMRLVNLSLSKYIYYQVTLVGKFIRNTDGNYIIEFAIFDNTTSQNLVKKGYKIEQRNIKSYIDIIANDVADEVYKATTGGEGYFNSSLIYVDENKLMLADYLGNHAVQLLKLDGSIYGPVFSHDNKQIAYVFFKDGRSSIYIYTLSTKKNEKLAQFKGLSLSPRFSPDNNRILFSVANDGATNIFAYDIKDKKVTKLTNSYSINLAGNYSPDGKYIVFNSDRIGRPHIYIMDNNGGNIRRISKGKGSYYNPNFAPNSNLILFTNLQAQAFAIGLLSMNGDEKIITYDKLVESPGWLNDGRHIVYQHSYGVKKDNKPAYAFFIMDIISGNKNFVKPSLSSLDPFYSFGILNNTPLQSKYIIPNKSFDLVSVIYFTQRDTQDSISGTQMNKLQEIMAYIKNHPNTSLEIIGYADLQELNDTITVTEIANLRAENVAQYFIKNGIPTSKILVTISADIASTQHPIVSKDSTNSLVIIKVNQDF